jgi:hypothetical protein
MIWLIVYLVLGVLIIFAHPGMRMSITERLRNPSGSRVEAVFIAGIVLIVALPMWPIILISRGRARSSEAHTLASIRTHLVNRGRNISENDSVLLSYQRVIVDQLRNVAKERGEKLPKGIIKEVSLHYLDLWVQMNESRLGIGMPLLINGAMQVYRDGGIQALLEHVREQQE